MTPGQHCRLSTAGSSSRGCPPARPLNCSCWRGDVDDRLATGRSAQAGDVSRREPCASAAFARRAVCEHRARRRGRAGAVAATLRSSSIGPTCGRSVSAAAGDRSHACATGAARRARASRPCGCRWPSGACPPGWPGGATARWSFRRWKGACGWRRTRDGDGLEDRCEPFSDDLAAPYGVAVHGDAVDVINKYGSVAAARRRRRRLRRTHRADGLGLGTHADYHDWAVGLPRDRAGNYYAALCPASRTIARKRPRRCAARRAAGAREPTADDPRRFAIEEICGGLRFPQGLALSPRGRAVRHRQPGQLQPVQRAEPHRERRPLRLYQQAGSQARA